MPVFYPSCVVNMKIRFDESLHVQTLGTPESLDDVQRAPSTGREDPTREPLVLQSGDANTSFVLGRVPIKCDVELPGYRQAGQFNCSIAFRDLPIDPRTVRAASVEIHMGTVGPGDFAAGMVTSEQDGTRRSILTTRDAAGVPDPKTLLMVGLADEWSVSHGDSGSTVDFRGRDLRGVLLDTPISVSPLGAEVLLETLKLDQPINVVVKQILAAYPFFQGFAVKVNAAEWKDGVIPAPGDAGAMPRHRKGAKGNRRGGRGTPAASQNDLNFWDLIVKYCYLVGAIPHFVGTDLRIRPSRSIFDQARGGFDPDNAFPFAGGGPRAFDSVARVDISPELRVRRLVYGRDVQSLSFDRKFGGYRKPHIVRAVSINSGSQERGLARQIEASWPPGEAGEGARRTRAAPGGQGDSIEVQNITVYDVASVEQLQEIARATFEEIGRGEMGGSVETRNLASFGGDNQDPDLVSLRPGDGIELTVDERALQSTSPLVSAYTDSTRDSFEKQISIVAARLGGDVNLARVIVATSRGAVSELLRFFRVANVKFGWDGQSGIKLAFDFENYVVVRNQVENASTAPGAVASQQVGNRHGRRGRGIGGTANLTAHQIEELRRADAVANNEDIRAVPGPVGPVT